jgi:hypothetical protein
MELLIWEMWCMDRNHMIVFDRASLSSRATEGNGKTLGKRYFYLGITLAPCRKIGFSHAALNRAVRQERTWDYVTRRIMFITSELFHGSNSHLDRIYML